MDRSCGLWDLISDVGSAMSFAECIFSFLCRFPYNVSHGQLKDRMCSTNRYIHTECECAAITDTTAAIVQ